MKCVQEFIMKIKEEKKLYNLLICEKIKIKYKYICIHVYYLQVVEEVSGLVKCNFGHARASFDFGNSLISRLDFEQASGLKSLASNHCEGDTNGPSIS